MGLTTLLLASTAAQAGGQILAGVAGSQQADFERDVALQNAKIARQRGVAQARRAGRDNERKLARARTAIASSGLTISGSGLDVLSDTASTLEEERQLVLFGAQGQARNFETQAAAAGGRSSSALFGGFAKAGGTLLTSVGGFKERFG